MSFEESVVAAHLASRLFFSSKLFPSMLMACFLTLSIAYTLEIIHNIQDVRL